MNADETDLQVLVAELESDLKNLEELADKNRKAEARVQSGTPDELDWAALGYTIHNIYNLIENSFLRIAKYFENSLSPDTRHKDLLRRMTLKIEGVRPAVLSEDLAERIDDLRSFRHVFRNMYQKTLDPERLQLLQKRLGSTLGEYRRSIERFVALLRDSSHGE